jgi:hypothetical protein
MHQRITPATFAHVLHRVSGEGSVQAGLAALQVVYDTSLFLSITFLAEHVRG